MCKLVPQGNFKQEFLTQMMTTQLRNLSQKPICPKKSLTAREWHRLLR